MLGFPSCQDNVVAPAWAKVTFAPLIHFCSTDFFKVVMVIDVGLGVRETYN